MNREHSVSWAGAEYHPDHTRCKYALPTIDLRCGQALPKTQLRPKQTYPRLIYAVPRFPRPISDQIRIVPTQAMGMCRWGYP